MKVADILTQALDCDQGITFHETKLAWLWNTLKGRAVSFYISLHPNLKTFYRGERSKSRYKENLGSHNIRKKGKTSYEDEVTNENSKGARYLFRIVETHNTHINLL
jgi:hypothetical protein